MNTLAMTPTATIALPRPISRIDLEYDDIGTRLVIQTWKRGEAISHGLVDNDDPGREFTFTLIRNGKSYRPSSFDQSQPEDETARA